MTAMATTRTTIDGDRYGDTCGMAMSGKNHRSKQSNDTNMSSVSGPASLHSALDDVHDDNVNPLDIEASSSGLVSVDLSAVLRPSTTDEQDDQHRGQRRPQLVDWSFDHNLNIDDCYDPTLSAVSQPDAARAPVSVIKTSSVNKSKQRQTHDDHRTSSVGSAGSQSGGPCSFDCNRRSYTRPSPSSQQNHQHQHPNSNKRPKLFGGFGIERFDDAVESIVSNIFGCVGSVGGCHVVTTASGHGAGTSASVRAGVMATSGHRGYDDERNKMLSYGGDKRKSSSSSASFSASSTSDSSSNRQNRRCGHRTTSIVTTDTSATSIRNNGYKVVQADKSSTVNHFVDVGVHRHETDTRQHEENVLTVSQSHHNVSSASTSTDHLSRHQYHSQNNTMGSSSYNTSQSRGQYHNEYHHHRHGHPGHHKSGANTTSSTVASSMGNFFSSFVHGTSGGCASSTFVEGSKEDPYRHHRHCGRLDGGRSGDSAGGHHHLEVEFSKLYADFHPPTPPPPPPAEPSTFPSSVPTPSSSRFHQMAGTTGMTTMQDSDVSEIPHPPEIRRLTLEDVVEQHRSEQHGHHSYESPRGGTPHTYNDYSSRNGVRYAAAVTPPSPLVGSRNGQSIGGFGGARMRESPLHISFNGSANGTTGSGSSGSGIITSNSNNASHVSNKSESTSWALPYPVQRSRSLDFLFSGGPATSRHKRNRRLLQQQQQGQQQLDRDQQHRGGGAHQGGSHSSHHSDWHHQESAKNQYHRTTRHYQHQYSSSYRPHYNDVNGSYMTT